MTINSIEILVILANKMASIHQSSIISINTKMFNVNFRGSPNPIGPFAAIVFTILDPVTTIRGINN